MRGLGFAVLGAELDQETGLGGRRPERRIVRQHGRRAEHQGDHNPAHASDSRKVDDGGASMP